MLGIALCKAYGEYMDSIKLLRLPDVTAVLGLKRSAIYQRVSDGRIPPPVHIGSAALWHSSEIADLVEYVRKNRHEPPPGTYERRGA